LSENDPLNDLDLDVGRTVFVTGLVYLPKMSLTASVQENHFIDDYSPQLHDFCGGFAKRLIVISEKSDLDWNYTPGFL
jgi:hypothetical protein